MDLVLEESTHILADLIAIQGSAATDAVTTAHNDRKSLAESIADWLRFFR